jgi:hypothetical protein
LIEVYHVPIVPASSLELDVVPEDAFVLSIDAEGYDQEILKSIDWTRFKPRVICVEDLEGGDNTSSIDFLRDRGYVRVWMNTVSAIFVYKSYLRAGEDVSQ